TSNSLAFYPLAPCRIADTRTSLGAPSLSPTNNTRTIPVLSSPCNIPSTAQAYSMNFTAVPGGSLDYLTVWPAGRTQPVVSTLNSSEGRIVANAAIVPAGDRGDISVFVSSGSKTDVVID